MLASAETIKVVADTLRKYNVTTTVVDPVRENNPYSSYIKTYIYRLWYRQVAHNYYPKML